MTMMIIGIMIMGWHDKNNDDNDNVNYNVGDITTNITKNHIKWIDIVEINTSKTTTTNNAKTTNNDNIITTSVTATILLLLLSPLPFYFYH